MSNVTETINAEAAADAIFRLLDAPGFQERIHEDMDAEVAALIDERTAMAVKHGSSQQALEVFLATAEAPTRRFVLATWVAETTYMTPVIVDTILGTMMEAQLIDERGIILHQPQMPIMPGATLTITYNRQ